MNDYQAFLESKLLAVQPKGKDISPSLIHPKLFPFQRDIVAWALRKGRAAIFADTGLGKTFMQLEWARLMGEKTLILAPLSVARQTVREAGKIGVEVRYVRSQAEISDGLLWITNYEMLDRFDLSQFGAIVLDESSILKAFDGKTRQKLIGACATIPYRLCCSATPAPNDYTELGNHAQFLGICSVAEMLARFFVNANKQQAIEVGGRIYEKKGSNKGGQEWRIKRHAEDAFFRWLASWAITITKPSDLGYDDDGFILPPLTVTPQFVKTDYVPDGQLLFTTLKGLSDRADIRRQTIGARLAVLQEIIGGSSDQWIVWAGLDAEAKAIAIAFPDAVDVKGSDSPESKAQAFEDFQDKKFRILLTKSKIGGHGMNFQQSHHMVFFGLNDSWESFYQCIRRQWRYMQESPVDVHIVMTDLETGIYQNIMRKEALAKRLKSKLVDAMRVYEEEELGLVNKSTDTYQEREISGKGWRMMLGDSCERLGELADSSVDLSVYSPPFADLYTYSASDRDLGNSRGWAQFFRHYGFIIREVLRVTKPGRLTCVHTSDIPAMQSRDGWIGVKDFPGTVIRAYERNGWEFVGRAFVQKNPQAQAIRVKSKALLFVQLRKDSADSRPALVDQILLFKKLGENAVPVLPVESGELDNETWIEWAHGIWLGISESDTLSYHQARGAEDEKHICPLQLGVIERCVKLYSNRGEVVLSPFAGIGSEGYEAVRLGRRFVGIELKPEYHKVAVDNLRHAEQLAGAGDLFSWAETGLRLA